MQLRNKNFYVFYICMKIFGTLKSVFTKKTPIIEAEKRTIGKHLIPRYLYHLTTKDSYEAISSQGVIEVQEELFKGQSIFLFDMDNFLKRWNFVPKKYGCSIKEGLIKRMLNRQKEIVLIRIDTQHIDRNALKIRTQEDLFDYTYQDEIKKIIKKYENCKNIPDRIKRKYTQFFIGDDAKNGNLYKQRKESIEYVYPFDILRKAFSKVGEYTENSDGTTKVDFLEVMKTLLKNQPESQALNPFIKK